MPRTEPVAEKLGKRLILTRLPSFTVILFTLIVLKFFPLLSTPVGAVCEVVICASQGHRKVLARQGFQDDFSVADRKISLKQSLTLAVNTDANFAPITTGSTAQKKYIYERKN